MLQQKRVLVIEWQKHLQQFILHVSTFVKFYHLHREILNNWCVSVCVNDRELKFSSQTWDLIQFLAFINLFPIIRIQEKVLI